MLCLLTVDSLLEQQQTGAVQQLLTVPLLRANWIESRSATGHQTSAIKHFCVTSILHKFRVW